MASINADVAEVEAQLAAIRLRRNGVAAQRALAGGLSVALLAASLIVGTALRAGTTLFAVATTFAAAGTVAAIAYAAWRTRREWLSLPATAHLADTHAALDDRLTTLLAVAPVTPAPVLRPLLIDQIIDARSRWGVEALAPQRLSRWLALVPLSLFIFAATAFYARPPGGAAAQQASAKALHPTTADPLGAGAVSERAGQDDELFTRDANDVALVTGAKGDALKGRHAGDRTGKGASAGNRGGDQSNISADGAKGAAAGDALSEEGNLDSLRESIREAFGAPPETSVGGDGGERDDQRPGGGSGRGKRDSGPPDSAKQGDGAANADAGKPGDASDTSAQAANPGENTTENADQNNRGSGRGGAGSAGSNAVLGATGSQRIEPDAGAPMAIKLSAISGVSPSQREPQRPSDNVPAATSSRSRDNGPLPDLANQQLADVAMQQLDVGPEHEAVIRRIFTRE